MSEKICEAHLKRCEQECTRDVIFLFQRRHWIHTGVPDGYDTDGESIWKREDNDDEDAPERLEWSDVQKMENDDGLLYMIETWLTESVWLDRDEAAAFGNRTSYRYPDGWRVYGVCAEGDLAKMLKAGQPAVNANAALVECYEALKLLASFEETNVDRSINPWKRAHKAVANYEALAEVKR